MRDQQDGALVFSQFLGQPGLRRNVQVVRGLVEQDVIGAVNEHLGQRDAHLPAAAELAAELVLIAGRKAEAVQHAPDALVDTIAVELIEAVE